MDRNSETIIDVGHGTMPITVSTQEATDYWPESVRVEQAGYTVCLPSADVARKVIKAVVRTSKLLDKKAMLTKIGREDGRFHFTVGEAGDEGIFVFIDQHGEQISIETSKQSRMLIDAIKAHATVLGWELP